MSPNEQRPVCSKCQTPMARYNVPHTGDKEQAWRLACSCKHSVVSEVVPSKDQLIALEMRPTSVEKTELVVRFNRPFTTAEMNAMHRGLNLHLVGGPDETAGNDARDAARYRVVRVSRLTGETLAHELDAACDKIVAARSAVEPTRRIPPREFDIESHAGLYTESAAPRGKPCTCDNCLGSSASCRVEAGERLGDLWYCRKAARAAEKASGTRLVEQRNGFKDGSTVPEQPAAPPSDKCEHGIPRQFCTAVHAEKTEASLPPCECLLIAKEPSAYHALKCPRFVANTR